MGAGVLGNPPQFPGKRQGVQHGDGLDDVLVDLEALLFAEGSPLHAQVEDLSEVVKVLRHVHLESVTGIEGPFVEPGNDVPGLVGEKCFDRRQFRGRYAFITPLLFVGQAEAVVEMAKPGPACDPLEPHDPLRVHGFAADVALRHEGEIINQLDPLLAVVPQGGFRSDAALDGLEALDLGVPEQHLETRAHLVDPVVDRLQLGRLVDHVFRGRDLAAVVEPRADPELPPLLLRLEVEIRKRPLLHPGGLFRQHDRQLRHPLAVAAGIGTLGVDGSRHEPDQGIHQGPLRLEQVVVFQRHR